MFGSMGAGKTLVMSRASPLGLKSSVWLPSELFLDVRVFCPASLPRGSRRCQFLVCLWRKNGFSLAVCPPLHLKRFSTAEDHASLLLCCPEQFSSGGQLPAHSSKQNQAGSRAVCQLKTINPEGATACICTSSKLSSF